MTSSCLSRVPAAPLRSALCLLLVVAAGPAFLAPQSAPAPGARDLQQQAPAARPWGLRSTASRRGAAARAVGVAPTTGELVDVSSVRSPPETYQALADKGAANAKKPVLRIFHQSFVSGCYVGFAGLLSLAIAGNIGPVAVSAPGLQKMIFAALFPVNLLLILNSGGQLFTGNTATVPMAVFEGKATLADLAKSWSVSILGNICGCGAFAAAALYAGLLVSGTQSLASSLAVAKTSLPFGKALVRAVMCNWMVCMAVFLSEASRTLGGKMVGIWFPISAFVAMSMEHSVANMFLIPAGILSGAPVSWAAMVLKNWVPVIIGNAIAGTVCVAASYSYAFGSLGK